MTDYSKMTDEEFDAIAMEIIKDPSSEWTSIPDVDELAREHFNNDVIDQWAKRNPDKAWLDKK